MKLRLLAFLVGLAITVPLASAQGQGQGCVNYKQNIYGNGGQHVWTTGCTTAGGTTWIQWAGTGLGGQGYGKGVALEVMNSIGGDDLNWQASGNVYGYYNFVNDINSIAISHGLPIKVSTGVWAPDSITSPYDMTMYFEDNYADYYYGCRLICGE